MKEKYDIKVSVSNNELLHLVNVRFRRLTDFNYDLDYIVRNAERVLELVRIAKSKGKKA